MCFPCNNEEFFAWEKKKKAQGVTVSKTLKKNHNFWVVVSKFNSNMASFRSVLFSGLNSKAW